jgi:putative sigma-54 modulation protein
MQIIITSRQMELTPRLRQHIERKVQRLSRFVNTDARVEVIVAEERTRSARDRYTVQVALTSGSHPIRSEVSAVNANTALDLVLDKVTTQLGRKKGREKAALRLRTSPAKVLSLSRSGELSPMEDGQSALVQQSNDQISTGVHASRQPTPAITDERNEEIWSRVMEIRRVQTKPMDDQEAIAQMESLGLAFYPFFNEATNSVNVMYRLETGGYGLLVPDLD